MTDDSQTTHAKDTADFLASWFFVWLGTVLAGGLFGLFAGGILGIIIGPFYAGIAGTPITISFAILSWACWLQRFPVPIAALSGIFSGVLSTYFFWDAIFNFSYITSICLAALIGGIGGGFFRCITAIRKQKSQAIHPEAWRFSLSDLFIRFSVVTVLVAVWIWAGKAHIEAREKAQLRRAQQQEKLNQLRANQPPD